MFLFKIALNNNSLFKNEIFSSFSSPFLFFIRCGLFQIITNNVFLLHISSEKKKSKDDYKRNDETMMMMMMSSTLTSSSSFNDVSNHNTRRFKKKNQFRLNTPTTKTTTAVKGRNKVQKNITIKAEAISEDSSSFSKNSDIFADLVENSFGSSSSQHGGSTTNNNGCLLYTSPSPRD